MTTASTQIKQLAKAVALAFSMSDITPEESSVNLLKHTDIPWNNPPLKCVEELDGTPLSYYFDSPIYSDGPRLYQFWLTTLDDLYDQKRHIITHGVFRGLGYVVKASLGQKAFRFSLPGGFPAELSEWAGIDFSLEAAHTARLSTPLKHFVEEGDSYYAILPDNRIIGVKDGLPAVPDTRWDTPATGMIEDKLSTPRGHTEDACLYDQIARARSLLWEHKKRFRGWQALDYSLQALRKLSLGTYCPPLLGSSQTAVLDVMVLEAREQALRQSLDVMLQTSINDRSKILTVQQLLVPLVLSASAFKAKLYSSGGSVPFVVQDKVITRIIAWLHNEYETRIPHNLKKA